MVTRSRTAALRPWPPCFLGEVSGLVLLVPGYRSSDKPDTSHKIGATLGFCSIATKIRPTASVFQEEESSPEVVCRTGFYPTTVMITWQKDGEDVHEDVELRDTTQPGWKLPEEKHSDSLS